ncbi:MAG: RNA 2'-phosphotransferase [Cytophagales bacterium]|nr:RNA 2'-phosphotransferase [Cytophagales bacterium]
MSTNEQQKMIKKISKLLSLALRHQPEALNIELDGQGWTDTSTLILAVNKHGISLDLELLKKVVQENDKQRFAFNKDHSCIRANQGHSVNIDLQLNPTTPPEFLYHGTVAKFMGSIKEQGLLKMNRQHVHLSPDVETAQNVGSRRGKPVILTIATGQMHQAGHEFLLSKNNVWLTDHVPADYILFKE